MSARQWIDKGVGDLELARGADHDSERRSDLQRAKVAFDNALAFDPEHVVARRLRGETLAQLGEHAAAAADLSLVLPLLPGDSDVALHLGQSLLKLGRHNEALAAFDECLCGAANDPNALYGRAEALTLLGRSPDALAAWMAFSCHPSRRQLDAHGVKAALLTIDFRQLRAELWQAILLARLGETFAAHAAFTRLFRDRLRELCGGFAPQEVAVALSELAAARQALATIANERADDPLTWRHVASAYASARLFDEALAACDAWLRVRPDDPDAWLHKAEALVASGSAAAAIPCFQRSLSLRPDHLGAKARLERVLADLAR